MCAPGGLTAVWSLEPDLITLGKFIGGGIPIGTYGMSAELSDVFEIADQAPGDVAHSRQQDLV